MSKASVYIQLLFRVPDSGKFYTQAFHHQCYIDRVNEQVAKRLERSTKRDPKPMKTTRSHFTHEGSPEQINRRKRILQYLNRDRWKMEGYYERGDMVNIKRKYSIIANRIDELVDIGLEFRLNELAELVGKYDRPLLEQIASSDDWTKRAMAFRAAATRTDDINY